jgi:hypothetical protein
MRRRWLVRLEARQTANKDDLESWIGEYVHVPSSKPPRGRECVVLVERALFSCRHWDDQRGTSASRER